MAALLSLDPPEAGKLGTSRPAEARSCRLDRAKGDGPWTLDFGRWTLQPWRRRLDRLSPRLRPFRFHFPLVYLVAARREDRVEIGAAETEVRQFSVGRWNDAIDPPGLVTHLQTHSRRHIESPIPID